MRYRRSSTAFLAVAVAATVGQTLPANADASPRARIAKTFKLSPLRTDIVVQSPSMGRPMRVTVLTPRSGGPRPTVYMLDGAGASKGTSDWITKGKAGQFFAGKNVNVVLPMGGAGTFYTNWRKRDRKLGKPQWETFLTAELPALVNSQFNGNGRNTLIGLSMGGQAAYSLLARHPDLYTGAASLSGCPPVSNPVNQGYVRTTVAKSGGDADNMWGPFGSKAWQSHDPANKLGALRGKNLYLSAGSGAIGPMDLAPRTGEDMPKEAVNASGSALELGAYRCSLGFAMQLRGAGIPYTDGFRLIGTHSWPYWRADLPAAWATVSRGL
ncbi:MAG: alpha/beta hydrolase family protein [Gordonia sp. (in: high G+C Gram-positive bacteria)]|uniref:alpha/beta hydrolase n=1 Tax=Gordonia sp. (in: high G+C Gram-positive bacteria) TaxID=84139 RepID=UPI0039E3E6AB